MKVIFSIQVYHFCLIGSKSEQESIEVPCSQEQSVVQESLDSTSASEKQSDIIIVHFNYGVHKFPKRISASTYEEFYRAILSIFQSKMDGYKPHNLQYRCGSEWYDLDQDTSFDDLGMDENQIWIQAVPMSADSESGNYHFNTVVINSRDRHKRTQHPNLKHLTCHTLNFSQEYSVKYFVNTIIT